MTVMPMLPEHAGALEELQRIVFPALAFAERLRAEHYLAHLRVFPEGQFVLTNWDVGMMNGYGAVRGEIGGEEYYREWLEGRREDPTLTRQRKIGFEPLGLIPGYLHDPTCGNYGVLLRLDAGCEV